jgi:hypothetical protein
MIKEIPKSDVVVRPFKVYKEWTLDETDITPVIGENIEGTLFDADTDPKSNGLYKRLVFDSIKAQFYTNSATASVLTEVGLRQNYTSTDERGILPDLELVSDGLDILTDDVGNEIIVTNPFNSIWVLPIPQSYYGEGIKVGSVTLVDNINNITYTDDGYSNLVGNGGINGNIFYDRGLIVMHDLDTLQSELTEFTISFRSTMTIYENEIFLSVLENEFNVSQNPTAVDEVGGRKVTTSITKPNTKLVDGTMVSQSFYQPGSKYIKNANRPFVSSFDGVTKGSFDDYIVSSSVDPTGSYLAPFITTIGLYDDELNMVAVAKLPQPIKSLPDYPINFIVRLDT